MSAGEHEAVEAEDGSGAPGSWGRKFEVLESPDSGRPVAATAGPGWAGLGHRGRPSSGLMIG